jgi:hypothetical protein
LALSGNLSKASEELAKTLASKLNTEELTFSKQLDSLWSLCLLQIHDTPTTKSLLKTLNGLNFERLDQELKYEEFLKVFDIYNSLKFEAPSSIKFENKGLISGIQGMELYMDIRYQEALTHYNPFKERVI